MANPPIDDVFNDCFTHMDAGANLLGKRVDKKGHLILKARYFRSFLVQLDSSDDAWEKSKDAVRHTATHIGLVAASLAAFDKKTTVEWPHAEKAGQIMEVECKLRFPERGQWCEPVK